MSTGLEKFCPQMSVEFLKLLEIRIRFLTAIRFLTYDKKIVKKYFRLPFRRKPLGQNTEKLFLLYFLSLR